MSFRRIASRAGITNRQLLLTRRMVANYPPYEAMKNEEESVKRKRLLYQSRKRGISENGILLSTFADRHLDSFTGDQLYQYDMLLNHPDNDWDIYYWATGREATPSYHDNSVMDLLKKHTQNTNREMRFHQPELK